MPETSGPRVSGTDEERQFDDLMWRDMFGDEPGVVGDYDGTAYKPNLSIGSDVVSVGSTTQASLCVIGGFRHRINAGETQGVTIPPAVGADRTDIIAARLDLATFTGLPGPIKLIRIAGTSSSIPSYDSSPPGVEDLPLWAITRKPGQTLAQATVQRLYPRLGRVLGVPVNAPLPISSPLDSLAYYGKSIYRRELGTTGTPAWVRTSSTGLPNNDKNAQPQLSLNTVVSIEANTFHYTLRQEDWDQFRGNGQGMLTFSGGRITCNVAGRVRMEFLAVSDALSRGYSWVIVRVPFGGSSYLTALEDVSQRDSGYPGAGYLRQPLTAGPIEVVPGDFFDVQIKQQNSTTAIIPYTFSLSVTYTDVH